MEISVAIIGDKLVGKTNLITKFVSHIYETKFSDSKYADHFIELITQKESVRSFKLPNHMGSLTLKLLESNDTPSVLKISVPNIVVFAFDLSNFGSLISLKESHRRLRCECRHCDVILVGTKYDFLCMLSCKQQNFISKEVLNFANSMKATVFYVSRKDSNMDQLFQYTLNRVFNLHVDRNCAHTKEPIILR